MRFTQKWKNFWQIQKHTTGGFTLVELIVVIAILAILAGIAVPAYSGYIDKANEAADQQLLAAINTAFSAACVEKGVNPYELDSSSADMPLTGEAGAKKVDLDNVVPAEVKDAFETFFAGNEDSAFKVYEDLYYSSLVGGFSNNVTRAYAYGGGTIYLSDDDVAQINNSTFMTAASLGGVSGLLTKVDGVTDFAAALVDDAAGGTGAVLLNQVFDSDGFQNYLGAKFTTAEMDKMLADVMAKDNISQDVAMDKLNANAAVLYAAEKAGDIDQSDITALLSSGNAKNSILTTMKSGTEGSTETAFAQAALAYGMYTAYAHATGNTEAQSMNAAQALVAMDNDPEFAKYMKTEQASKDLDGYMAALGVISDSADDKNAVTTLLTNGFADADLIGVIEDGLGSN